MDFHTSSDGTTAIWLLPLAGDSGDPRPLTPPLPHHDSVNSVAFSPNGEQLLSASDDGNARLWDIRVRLDASPQVVEAEAQRALGMNAGIPLSR